MKWGVRTYNEWRAVKISSPESYDVNVDRADLDNVRKIPKESLVVALCKFIPEVTKVRDGSDYPDKTLYEMIVCIQKFLNENSIPWRILEDPEFIEVRTVLDNVMKERALCNIGVVRRQAEVITPDHEEKLWIDGVLGEQTPTQLRETVLFLLGINLGLRAVDEHYNLRRDSKDRGSQLSFERDSEGVRCLVYREDTVTKTNDGGLKNLKKERKVVWVYPSSNPVHCPVRFVDKYVSLLPPVNPKTGKCNFYCRGLDRVTPAQWYGDQVIGKNTLRKVVSSLLKSANLDGYFTNHSLHRTSATRLFQAGIDRKLVKEFTGHVCDAVDKYQVTSDTQHNDMSKILKNETSVNSVESDNEIDSEVVEPPKESLEITVKDVRNDGKFVQACECKKSNVKIGETDQIGAMLCSLIDAKRAGKATIKIEVEFS